MSLFQSLPTLFNNTKKSLCIVRDTKHYHTIQSIKRQVFQFKITILFFQLFILLFSNIFFLKFKKIDEPPNPIIYKNASFHGVQTAQPQLGLAQRRIFIYYRIRWFCLFSNLQNKTSRSFFIIWFYE